VVPGLQRTFNQLLRRLLAAVKPEALPPQVRQDLERAIHVFSEPPAPVSGEGAIRMSAAPSPARRESKGNARFALTQPTS
jgi:hypothetical protein